uniref:Berberine demethylenase n=1 Tax=Rhodococcus sp. BD7100 TaxID=1940306 RepID=A0A1Q2TD20_9NOCA|nr:berberine demethylenase [Rhodococcus sp. BD7100]
MRTREYECCAAEGTRTTESVAVNAMPELVPLLSDIEDTFTSERIHPMPSFRDSLVAQLRHPIQFHAGDMWGPPQYTNWMDEERSWKDSCYLGDWTFLPTIRYTGPDVLKLFADCSVNTMNNFKIGQSKHIIHTNRDGKVIEDGLLTRTADEELICYSSYWADYIRRNGNYRVDMEPIEQVKFHLQGPNALFVLETALGRDFRDLKFMRNEDVTIAGVPTRVLRQGMSGEIGFELQADKAQGQILRETILEAGTKYGIHEMGGRVAMLNHLQAAYPTVMTDYLPAMYDDDGAGYLEEYMGEADGYFARYYGAVAGSFESDDVSGWYRSPVELGWGGRINFDHKFRGDEALRVEKADPKRTLCTLKWNSDDIIDIYASLFRQGDLPDFMEMPQDPRHYLYFDKILKDGKEVGATSSRGYSAHFREMISLAVLDIELAVPGTDVTVVWGAPGSPQREIRATTALAPYKEVRSRVDLTTLPARPF